MSTINVTNLSGRGGATPNLPDGANITGVATATTFSGTLDGSLKTTGTPTLGLGVTINASGVAISGVATAGIISATTLYGDGSNLTGVGESIAPHYYNPDVNDTKVSTSTGIGITFNKKVVAGSGTATIKMVNAGVAGTTIQSWGISSATYNVTDLTLGALVSNLIINETYQLNIPEGFVVSTTGTNYAGTAYTFTVQGATGRIFTWGYNADGYLGIGNENARSSPVQVPGTNWGTEMFTGSARSNGKTMAAVKTDGTLWTWGNNQFGARGTSSHGTHISSPIQIGSGTDWSSVSMGKQGGAAIKTDGTLYVWGLNDNGQVGDNSKVNRSSPTQIPGTTWSKVYKTEEETMAIKTDGTLWGWGENINGELGINVGGPGLQKSSPTQIPGTTWRSLTVGSHRATLGTKTDGTLWSWGFNEQGQLGLNQAATTKISSPTQVPGTNWSENISVYDYFTLATKTDGTLWTWGYNGHGALGDNSNVSKSSPVQVPGTTWSTTDGSIASGTAMSKAIKTDGTLWVWGNNNQGQLGLSQTEPAQYSSPIQIPGTDWARVRTYYYASIAQQTDTTP